MLKYILLAILLISNLSCKKIDEKIVQKKSISNLESIQVIDTTKKEINNTEQIIEDCSKTLFDLIISSNIKSPFKNELKIEIESQNIQNIKFRLFVEDSNNTIGWIIFDAENKRLLDITNDIENPEELKFETKKWNNVIDCFFKKNKSYYIEIGNKSSETKNCKTTTIEMGEIEECIFINSSIEKIYNDIIKNSEIEESKYLLKIIPKKSSGVKINKNGLMNIEYKINPNKIDIEFNYEGGVNFVQIEQLKENVKRTITHSAD